jgi:hypothetical protein
MALRARSGGGEKSGTQSHAMRKALNIRRVEPWRAGRKNFGSGGRGRTG